MNYLGDLYAVTKMTPFYKYAFWPIIMAKDAYERTPTEYLPDFHKQVNRKLCLTRHIKKQILKSRVINQKLSKIKKQLAWSMHK